MKKILCLMFTVVLMFIVTTLNARTIAVMPYRINQSTDDIPSDINRQYAQLVSIIGSIDKGCDLFSVQQMENEMKKIGLNPQNTVTAEDLILLGKACRQDYIIAGSIKATSKKYKSESILFSVQQGKVISRTKTESNNIYSLATKEVHSLLLQFDDQRNQNQIFTDKPLDVTYLIDESFNMLPEVKNAREAIFQSALNLYEYRNSQVEFNIVYFSDRNKDIQSISGLKTPAGVREKLGEFKPNGGTKYKSFDRAFSYVVKNVPWRRNTERLVIIVTNSPDLTGNELDLNALKAQRDKTRIFALAFGQCNRTSVSTLNRITDLTKGKVFLSAYRQKLYNVKGEPFYVYSENNRLFYSLTENSGWEKGLFENRASGPNGYAPVRNYLTEIFFNENDVDLNPYDLKKTYQSASRDQVINAESWEENSSRITSELVERYISDTSYGDNGGRLPIGKVLVSSGDLNFWLKVYTPDDMRFFEREKELGIMFPIGVRIQDQPDDLYRVKLSSPEYITKIRENDIPKIIFADLHEVVKSPLYYVQNGAGSPPLWFVNVKVVQTEFTRENEDIRGQ